jgi:hypothetical protein
MAQVADSSVNVVSFEYTFAIFYRFSVTKCAAQKCVGDFVNVRNILNCECRE